MVVYIPSDLTGFVEERRRGKETKIVERSLDQFPLFRHRERVENIMRSLPSRGIKHQNIEMIHPDYAYLVISKFDMLREVSRENPFKSDYFIWADAGYFRNKPDFDCSLPWPDCHKIHHLDQKYLVQNIGIRKNPDILNDPEAFFSRLDNEIMAAFHGGGSVQIENMANDVERWFHYLLDHGLINNEQQIMSMIIQERWNDFILYPPRENNRRLFHDFASETPIAIGYPLCPHLKVLTVVTREISDKTIDKWRNSASYYGYDWEIVGRNKRWEGWSGRTKMYLGACESLQSPVIMTTDGTDVIFTGSAWEAYEKYQSMAQPTIVGGEYIIAYSGKRDHYKVEDFFVKRAKSRFAYPNAGMIIGGKKEITNLFRLNQDSPDDQAGIMDIMMDGIHPVEIDYDTAIFGNVPNLSDYSKWEIGFWDHKDQREGKSRPSNTVTGNRPCVMHFPGNHHLPQTEFYHKYLPPRMIDINMEQPNLYRDYLLADRKEYLAPSGKIPLGLLIAVIIILLALVLLVWNLASRKD